MLHRLLRVLMTTACALVLVPQAPASAAAKQPAAAAPAPKPRVDANLIEASGPKPAWVSQDNDFYLQEGKRYFRSVLDKQDDLQLGMEAAKASAMADVRKSIVTTVAAEFGQIRETGSNNAKEANAVDAPEYQNLTRSQVATVARAMQLPGMQQEASYWELRKAKDANGEAAEAYRIYVLVSIPEKIRLKAQAQAQKAIEGMTKDAGAAREKLQNTIEEMK